MSSAASLPHVFLSPRLHRLSDWQGFGRLLLRPHKERRGGRAAVAADHGAHRERHGQIRHRVQRRKGRPEEDRGAVWSRWDQRTTSMGQTSLWATRTAEHSMLLVSERNVYPAHSHSNETVVVCFCSIRRCFCRVQETAVSYLFLDNYHITVASSTRIWGAKGRSMQDPFWFSAPFI